MATWAHWFTGSYAFRPDISWLVLDGAQIAAYLLAYFWAADATATGEKEAYIGQIGTRAPWRRRGLGELMLARALAGSPRLLRAGVADRRHRQPDRRPRPVRAGRLRRRPRDGDQGQITGMIPGPEGVRLVVEHTRG